MSTRVHELAKELGLKSAELLERILSWGLDVKASNFASLDQATVDRIRDLSARSASGEGGLSGAPQGVRPTPASPAVSATPQPGRPSSKDASATKLAGTSPASASAPSAHAQPRSEPAPRSSPAGSQVLAPGSSPAAAPPVAKVMPGSAPAGAPASSAGAAGGQLHSQAPEGGHGPEPGRRRPCRATADFPARGLAAGRSRHIRRIEDPAVVRTLPGHRLPAGWSREVLRRARWAGRRAETRPADSSL